MEDGKPRCDHLAAAAKRSAVARAQLAGPEFPEVLEHVWGSFLDLSSARSQGPHGPDPISYAELAAWSHLTRTPLLPWEVELLRDLDAAWLADPKENHGPAGQRQA